MMVFLVIFTNILFSVVYAQTESAANFSATKATVIPYYGDLIYTDIEKEQVTHGSNQDYFVLAICAPDLIFFSSEADAIKAVKKGLTGFVLTYQKTELVSPLSLIRVRNLMGMGHGFVYLDDVHGSKNHSEYSWMHIGLSKLTKLTLSNDSLEIQSKYFSLHADGNGHSSIKIKWRHFRNRFLNKRPYYCSWNKTSDIHFLR